MSFFRHLIYFKVERKKLLEVIELAQLDYDDILIKVNGTRFDIYGKSK